MCFPQKKSYVYIFGTCEERNVRGEDRLFWFWFETEAQAVFGQEAKGKSGVLPPTTNPFAFLCSMCSLTIRIHSALCIKANFGKILVFTFSLFQIKTSIIAFHRHKNTSLQPRRPTLSHRGVSVGNVALFCHKLLISECIWKLIQRQLSVFLELGCR